MKNYYQILGVNPSAPIDEIKAAYKRLTTRVNPGMSWGEKVFEEISKNVNEAYQVLADEQLRSEYNQQYRHFFFTQEAPIVQEALPPTYHFDRQGQLNKRIIRNIIICIILLFAFIGVYAETPTVPGKKTITKKFSTANRENILHSSATATITWSEEEMITVVKKVMQEKAKAGSKATCVKLYQSANSNVSNGMTIANYLQLHSFTIAGRLTVATPSQGIQVNCSSDCITITIGRVNRSTVQ